MSTWRHLDKILRKLRGEGTQKFPNQRFSKSSRKEHVQNLAENDVGSCGKYKIPLPPLKMIALRLTTVVLLAL